MLECDGESLTDMAPLLVYLPELARHHALRRALDTIRENAANNRFARALGELAPYLAGPLAIEAVDVAVKIPDSFSRRRIVADLIPSLEVADRAQALQNALGPIGDNVPAYERAMILAAVLPHLPLEPALDAVRGFDDRHYQERLLCGLAASLPPDGCPPAVDLAQELQLHDGSLWAALLTAHGNPRWTDTDGAIGARRALSFAERRSDVLGILAAVATSVSDEGGHEAVAQCIAAIEDVRRWWP